MAELNQTSLYTDANLVSYYRLESTADSKGSNTLTNNNSVAFNPGLFGNAADFGSANTNKSLQDGTLGITGSGALGVSFWVKLSTEISSGSYGIFTHSISGGRYCQVYYEYNGGTRRLQLDNAGTAGTYNVALGTSTWHHFVLNRSGADQKAELYLDNVKQISTIAQGGGSGGGNFILLGSDNSNVIFLSGLMDDLGAFSRTLTAAEVNTLYQPAGGFFALL